MHPILAASRETPEKAKEADHPIVLSPPLQIQSHRRGDNAVCSGPNQLFVQRVTKPAALIHRVDRVTLGNLFFHPGQQLGSGELLRRPNQTPLTLYRRHNVAKVHVQTELEVQPLCAIASAHQVVSILSVMKGWFVFHTRRVPVLPTLYNPSWHLTAPFHCEFIELATTPCVGLSLSR